MFEQIEGGLCVVLFVFVVRTRQLTRTAAGRLKVLVCGKRNVVMERASNG